MENADWALFLARRGLQHRVVLCCDHQPASHMWETGIVQAAFGNDPRSHLSEGDQRSCSPGKLLSLGRHKHKPLAGHWGTQAVICCGQKWSFLQSRSLLSLFKYKAIIPKAKWNVGCGQCRCSKLGRFWVENSHLCFRGKADLCYFRTLQTAVRFLCGRLIDVDM